MTAAQDVETSTTKLLYVPARILDLNVPVALRDAAHYVLHATFCGRAIRRAKSSWVPLNAELLRSISRACKAGKDWLLEHGVLETNGSYQAGVSSTGYRWSDPYESARRVPTTMGITRAILRSQRDRDVTFSAGARHLIGRLRHIHIDAAAAYQTIRELEPRRGSAWPTEEYRSFLHTSVRLLADGHHYHVVDEYGRLHTPISSLHRRLRRHLRAYDVTYGQPLINLDIRNSQPLCLGLLLNGQPDERQPREPSHPPHLNLHQRQEAQSTTPPWTHREDVLPYVGRNAGCRHQAACPDSDGAEGDWLTRARERQLGRDVADYLRTCEAGRFYESLMQFFPAMRDAAEFMSVEERQELRSAFKAKVFGEILFGPVRDTQLTVTFRDLWPAVWSRIVQEKGGPDGYPSLARAMQRSESALMIDRLGGRLAEELPHVPVATIHDSLLVPQKFVERVQAIILDEWARAGLRPSICATPA